MKHSEGEISMLSLVRCIQLSIFKKVRPNHDLADKLGNSRGEGE